MACIRAETAIVDGSCYHPRGPGLHLLCHRRLLLQGRQAQGSGEAELRAGRLEEAGGARWQDQCVTIARSTCATAAAAFTARASPSRATEAIANGYEAHLLWLFCAEPRYLNNVRKTRKIAAGAAGHVWAGTYGGEDVALKQLFSSMIAQDLAEVFHVRRGESGVARWWLPV